MSAEMFESEFVDVEVKDSESTLIVAEGPFKIVSMYDVARIYWNEYSEKVASVKDIIPDEDIVNSLSVENMQQDFVQVREEFVLNDESSALDKVKLMMCDKKDVMLNIFVIPEYKVVDPVAYELYVFISRYKREMGVDCLWHKVVSSLVVYFYFRRFDYMSGWRRLLCRCADHRYQNMINLMAKCFDWQLYFSYPFVEWLDYKVDEETANGFGVDGDSMNDICFLYYDLNACYYDDTIDIPLIDNKIQIKIERLLSGVKCKELPAYMLVNKQFYYACLKYVEQYNRVEYLPAFFDTWGNVKDMPPICASIDNYKSGIVDKLVHSDDNCFECQRSTRLIREYGGKDSQHYRLNYVERHTKTLYAVEKMLGEVLDQEINWVMMPLLELISRNLPVVESGMYAYIMEVSRRKDNWKATETFKKQREYYECCYPYHIVKLFVPGSFGIGYRFANS